jgi:Na+-translocating ferredoxin:NAD+ oxidoreductase RnfC subunit
MARELIVSIDDELDNEMKKYPEVDWCDAARKSLRECIRQKEIAEIYTIPVERALLEEK